MSRVGEDFFTLQWVCGGLVYPGAFEHSGLGRLLAEMLRPGCPVLSESTTLSIEVSIRFLINIKQTLSIFSSVKENTKWI